MKYSVALLVLLLVVVFSDRGSSSSEGEFPPFHNDSIIGVPSSGNFLLYEQVITTESEEPLQRIQSDVPLTVERYLSDKNDGGSWLGGEPLAEGTALVLVSSSCDTSDTTVIPVVEIVKAGNDTILSIKVGVPENQAIDMPFLSSSSYDATWYEAGCPMPTFPSTTTTTGSTASPLMTTTTQLVGDEGKLLYAPCASEMACDDQRQQLGLTRFEVGEFPMKGCFSKSGIAYWSTGGSAEDESRADLPGIQERIWCDDAKQPDATPTPSITAGSTEIPTMITTVAGEAKSIFPTMVVTTTSLGGEGGKLLASCASESACDERRQQFGITRFEVGEFPSKGCFSKNGVAYWSTGGSAEDELREDLPGIQERIWCEANDIPGDAQTRQGNPCETGPSADPTKACKDGQFCELTTGVCNTKLAVFEGVCTDIPQACTLNYMPVRVSILFAYATQFDDTVDQT